MFQLTKKLKKSYLTKQNYTTHKFQSYHKQQHKTKIELLSKYFC